MDGEHQPGNKERKSLDSKEFLASVQRAFERRPTYKRNPDQTEDLGYDLVEKERTHRICLKLSLKGRPEKQSKGVKKFLTVLVEQEISNH